MADEEVVANGENGPTKNRPTRRKVRMHLGIVETMRRDRRC